MTANPLRQRIVDVIRREGPIPFSRYMAMCLYEPELGYYARPCEQFGKAGDFYTSSDVHALFGRLLCRQFVEFWQMLSAPAIIDLIELGPGRGLFARDVLDWAAKKHPEFLRALRYRLVETSPWLRQRQQERLAEFVATGQVTIDSEFSPAVARCGDALIVFGNEFFDALPVEVLTSEGELRVAETDGALTEQTVDPRPQVLEYLDRYGVHPPGGGRVEVSLAGLEWMRRVTDAFASSRGPQQGSACWGGSRRGFAVFIDYGYTRPEQLAGRHLDTLMTYRQHRATGNPYEAPGEQDITAHVNFTALRAAAEQGGLEYLALLTQSQFLMGVGEPTQFAEAFEDCALPQEQAKVALQLKHLVTPAGIGEIFQVLVLSHGVDAAKARTLSGLKFAR
ncbi:MAG: SAM-dependent methyltransferase [Candidatus Korobacteraceae bacterium]